MRILADENIPRMAVAALRAAGHDVIAVGSQAPGSADDEVLALAAREERVLITGDKDFGEIVFRAGSLAPTGLILVRVHGSPEARTSVLLAALASRPADEWTGHFAVIEEERVRLTPLPPPSSGDV